jgi:Uma2 family endonuclease
MATMPNLERLWTIEEYLRTSWSPDRELVNGRIEERNLGEREHSIIQRYLTSLFDRMRDAWEAEVYPGLRTQTGTTNFRVPDVLVVREEDYFERYITRPPLIAVETLSPEDTRAAIEKKSTEYHEFGVENIWVIDPDDRIAYAYGSSALEEVTSGELVVPGTPIRVVLSQMFAELDRGLK